MESVVLATMLRRRNILHLPTLGDPLANLDGVAAYDHDTDAVQMRDELPRNDVAVSGKGENKAAEPDLSKQVFAIFSFELGH
uniref:Uncharacterized protein n=1 Tax=Oryza barthii TaxID=65489 RepID=A0A0D3F4D7_9ORYZ